MSVKNKEPRLFHKSKSRWLVAGLGIVFIVYQYVSGNMEPLLFWALIIIVILFYSLTLIAQLFPKTRKYLVGNEKPKKVTFSRLIPIIVIVLLSIFGVLVVTILFNLGVI